MNLNLNPDLADGYKNPAQIARVVTEPWVRDNLYCLRCRNDYLTPTKRGIKVVDFTCDSCKGRFQLKSQKRPFGKKVTDAAYQPMADSIISSTVPNFIFLQYDSTKWIVNNLFGIPKHFMTLSVLEKRKPLPPTARRAGWVGCNILLYRLPSDAKISVVENNENLPTEKVRNNWSRYELLSVKKYTERGWLADTLACVRRLNQRMFTLKDIYQFEEELSQLHPQNRHVKAKIRQQLQVLRDQGIIKFLDRGHYLLLKE